MTPMNKMFLIGVIHIIVTTVLALTVPYAVESVPLNYWGDFGVLYNEDFWYNAIWMYAAAGWFVSYFLFKYTVALMLLPFFWKKV